MADKQVRNLKISFLVWRELVSRLRDPADTLETVIVRLLGLPETVELREPRGVRAGIQRGMPPRVPARGLAGVPDGTRLRWQYKGKEYAGRVEDGVVHVDQAKGRTFGSLSAAAEHFSRGHQNGWAIIQCKVPGSQDWIQADTLRRGNRKRAPEDV